MTDERLFIYRLIYFNSILKKFQLLIWIVFINYWCPVELIIWA